MDSKTVINVPFERAQVEKLKSGDYVYLTGTLYSARDAAHKRLYDSIVNAESGMTMGGEAGNKTTFSGKELYEEGILPLDITDNIFYSFILFCNFQIAQHTFKTGGCTVFCHGSMFCNTGFAGVLSPFCPRRFFFCKHILYQFQRHKLAVGTDIFYSHFVEYINVLSFAFYKMLTD